MVTVNAWGYMTADDVTIIYSCVFYSPKSYHILLPHVDTVAAKTKQ